MSASYEELLEKITAPTLTTENWDGILTYCDKINLDAEGAKNGLKVLRKRLNNRDPHVILMTISVLDSCWANCNERFRKEVSSAQFINELKSLCTNSQRLVAEKMRVTLQKWIDTECKTEPALSLVISLHRNLKDDGYSFVVEDPKKKQNQLYNEVYAKNPNYVGSAQEEEELAKAIAASLADAEKQEKFKKNTQNLYPTASNSNINNSSNGNAPPASSTERKVRALYDFEAAESNELSFVAGNIIVITDESNPHWWTGRIGSKQGLFPSSFVTNELEEKPEKEANKQPKAQQIEASINEAILVRCLNELHECDPTGERPDPVDLQQLESASYAQGPLIDSQLASIDRQTNALAQIDIAIRDVLALYDEAIQKGGYQPVTSQSMYAPLPISQPQYSAYPQQQQQQPVHYQGYPEQPQQQYPQYGQQAPIPQYYGQQQAPQPSQQQQPPQWPNNQQY